MRGSPAPDDLPPPPSAHSDELPPRRLIPRLPRTPARLPPRLLHLPHVSPVTDRAVRHPAPNRRRVGTPSPAHARPATDLSTPTPPCAQPTTDPSSSPTGSPTRCPPPSSRLACAVIVAIEGHQSPCDEDERGDHLSPCCLALHLVQCSQIIGAVRCALSCGSSTATANPLPSPTSLLHRRAALLSLIGARLTGLLLMVA